MSMACGSGDPLADIASFGNIGLYETYFKLKAADPLLVIKWCQFHGLIAKEYICPVCSKPMKLVPRKEVSDHFGWGCRTEGGDNPHRIQRSIRNGTWFELSRLTIPQILLLSFMWCAKEPHGFIAEQLQISPSTVTDWANFCREVCFEIFVSGMGKIGGPGTVVEIDESKFGKRKFKRGRRVDGQWVFGGIERGSGRCFFSAVENRTRDTLLSVIKENILPGTTIVSDCWKAYDCLSYEGFIHLTVNHSLTFKDPDTGAHTNTIEGTWGAIKRGFSGTRKADGLFDSYLAEYIWRKSSVSTEEKMKSFWSMVSELYPPHKNDQKKKKKNM